LATRQTDGSIRLKDGRVVFANSLIQGQDLLEILDLVVPGYIKPLWPFAHGGGGGGFVASGGGGSPTPGGGGGGGTPGQNGAQGNQGVQGPFGGPQGNQGDQGPQGAQGRQGNQGNQGAIGTGAQGNQGGQGAQGRQGNQGNQGAVGTGAQGPQGNQGNQGGQGAQGNQGAIGTGSQGNQGFQGPSTGGGGLFENNQSNTAVTVDATPTVILSETLASPSVATFRVVVDARYNDGSQHASFVKTVRVHNEGGGAVLGVESSDYTDDSSFALFATFIAAGNDIQVQVTGVAATTITWKARMGRVILP
jgi:hypothetical protein